MGGLDTGTTTQRTARSIRRSCRRIIATGLRGCGFPDPEVILEQVPELSRQVSGKLKRFVPWAPATSV